MESGVQFYMNLCFLSCFSCQFSEKLYLFQGEHSLGNIIFNDVVKKTVRRVAQNENRVIRICFLQVQCFT